VVPKKKGIYTTIVQDFEIEENRLAAANCPVNIIKIVELG
jgi:ferredoxin